MSDRRKLDALRAVADDARDKRWHDAHFYAPQLGELLAALNALTLDDVRSLRSAAGDFELSGGRFTSVGHELLALADKIERVLT